MSDERNIDSLLQEHRVIEPPDQFRANALVADEQIYQDAARDPEAFWAEQAGRLEWFTPWQQVMNWTPPWVRWFEGGTLNATVSCLDRHADATPGRVAYHFEGEPGDRRTITYAQLRDDVCRFANALRRLGIGKGDRVAIYMGMVPELPATMLACARIGAVHSVVFGGFSPEALRDRIDDAKAKAVVTCDGAWRRGTVVPLKDNVDLAVAQTPTIESVVVVRRIGDAAGVSMTAGRDHWYDEIVSAESPVCEPERMDAEDPLYILYTSGTTGKPKGILHTTGG